jgi:hypothetical protein
MGRTRPSVVVLQEPLDQESADEEEEGREEEATAKGRDKARGQPRKSALMSRYLQILRARSKRKEASSKKEANGNEGRTRCHFGCGRYPGGQ